MTIEPIDRAFMGFTVELPRSTATWHQHEVADILAELNSTRLGLSQAAVQENLAKYGKNILNEAQPRSGIIVFLGYFWSIPVALLILAAILSIATGSSVDALVIMGVVIINAVLGYVTESKSEGIILSLKNLVNPSAWVIRDGKSIEIDSQTIVVGDILLLRPGSYVAADARLIESPKKYPKAIVLNVKFNLSCQAIANSINQSSRRFATMKVSCDVGSSKIFCSVK